MDPQHQQPPVPAPNQTQTVVTPSPEAIEHNQRTAEENQAGKNFIGNDMPQPTTAESAKVYVKQHGASVAGLFVGVVVLIVASVFFNVPAVVMLIVFLLFIGFLIWKLFEFLRR